MPLIALNVRPIKTEITHAWKESHLSYRLLQGTASPSQGQVWVFVLLREVGRKGRRYNLICGEKGLTLFLSNTYACASSCWKAHLYHKYICLCKNQAASILFFHMIELNYQMSLSFVLECGTEFRHESEAVEKQSHMQTCWQVMLEAYIGWVWVFIASIF